MQRSAIADAITARIEAAEIAETIPQVAYPNVGGVTGTPRIEIEWIAADRSDRTLRQTSVRERGRFGGVIVVAADGGEATANAHADAFAGLFPGGLSLEITGGRVVFDAPPTIRGGYRDGPEWRVPVIVPYFALAR